MFGYIYILSNPLMPGILKIGRTERNPAERLTELSSASGVPAPFALEYSAFVVDLDSAETEIHLALNAHRVSENREFFRLSVDKAKEIVRDKAIDMLASRLLEYDDDTLVRLVDFIVIRRKAIRNYFR